MLYTLILIYLLTDGLGNLVYFPGYKPRLKQFFNTFN